MYLKKDNKVKIESSVKKMLKEEENFGIKKFKTYKEFGKKVYKIRDNVIKNIKTLKEKNKTLSSELSKIRKAKRSANPTNLNDLNNEIDNLKRQNSNLSATISTKMLELAGA